MITDSGNALSKWILDKEKEMATLASYEAISYAQTDDKIHKMRFEKYSEIEDVYRNIHQVACNHMHRIESEMQKRNEDKK